ncbi:MAG: transcription termination/antitermination protein NusG [Candidatus Firestonebacteria bacterium]|jgi:transcriptional antiterminator NusG|nr:transcription termination/antitermination protein NusG [Candidatus Firestonebacteria bacterium]
MEKKWYIITTYSGYEEKVKANLEYRARTNAMTESISQVLIPKENVIEIKGGKKKTVSRKFYPGYILVEMDMNDDTWTIVRNTPKVTGFVRAGIKPLALSEEQFATIKGQVDGNIPRPKHVVEYEKGQLVRVTEGPFTNFSGVVEEVYPERMKVKVMVSVFNRPTLVEVEFRYIEKQ